MPAGPASGAQVRLQGGEFVLELRGQGVANLGEPLIDQGDLGLPFRRVDLEGLGDLLDARVETRGARRDSNP